MAVYSFADFHYTSQTVFSLFFILLLLFSGKWENLLFSRGVIIVESGDCQRDLFKLGLSVPIRTLGVFVNSSRRLPEKASHSVNRHPAR